MHDEVVHGGIGDGLSVVLFQVRAAGLGPGANGRRVVLVDVSGGAGLVEVGTGLVVAGDEEADAVRPADVGLGGALVAVGQVGHEAAGGHVGAVDVLVVEALGAHPLGQRAGVGGEAGDAHAHVGVDLQNFLLVGGEFGYRPLEGTDDGVRGGPDSDAGRSLCVVVLVGVCVVVGDMMDISVTKAAMEGRGSARRAKERSSGGG